MSQARLRQFPPQWAEGPHGAPPDPAYVLHGTLLVPTGRYRVGRVVRLAAGFTW